MSDYVTGACSACVRGGCQLTQAQQLAGQAAQVITQYRRERMSQALWCDATGHAFSERDPDRQRISISTLDEKTGEEKVEARDFCGECAQAAGLLKRKTRPAEADPLKIKVMENQLGIGQ